MQNEFTSHKIILPDDDYDMDEELDLLIDKIERAKRRRIDRGTFYGI